jgi:hypothetical protein
MSKNLIAALGVAVGAGFLYLYWRRGQPQAPSVTVVRPRQTPQAPARRIIFMPQTQYPGQPIPVPAPQSGVPTGLDAISLARCGPGKTLITGGTPNTLQCATQPVARCMTLIGCVPPKYQIPTCACATDADLQTWPILTPA